MNNDIKGPSLQAHQDAVAKTIFKEDSRRFVENYRQDTWLYTWNNSKSGYVSKEVMLRIASTMGVLGPIASVFGRTVEMLVASKPKPDVIAVEDFERSVNSGDGLQDSIFTEYPDESGYGRQYSHYSRGNYSHSRDRHSRDRRQISSRRS